MADITVKDIAVRLGVSPATVSLALNNRPGVNAQTRKKVLALVEELNYTGNTLIRSRKAGKTNGLINFVVYKRSGKVIADTQFFTTLIEAVEKEARECEYTITLTYCENERQFQDSLKLAESSSLAGMIILGTEMNEDDALLLNEINIPVVVLDNDLFSSAIDTVGIHNMKGIWQAVNCLQQQGHENIGYLKSGYSIRNFDYRFLGYKYSMDRLGLAYDDKFTFLLEPSIDGAFADMQILLANDIKMPTAFLADNDLIALGAIKAMKQTGIHIPEDISIVGFD